MRRWTNRESLLTVRLVLDTKSAKPISLSECSKIVGAIEVHEARAKSTASMPRSHRIFLRHEYGGVVETARWSLRLEGITLMMARSCLK
jgi:hypothetical protein